MNSLNDTELLTKKYKYKIEDIEELKAIPESIKHKQEAIIRLRESVGLGQESDNYLDPVYSFHCPGDYNQITSFINELDDN